LPSNQASQEPQSGVQKIPKLLCPEQAQRVEWDKIANVSLPFSKKFEKFQKKRENLRKFTKISHVFLRVLRLFTAK